MKYRKKPIVIEAIKWDGLNQKEIFKLIGHDDVDFIPKGVMFINTLEGSMTANIGDYIIKEPFDKERKCYPCKPGIFKQTYEKMSD